MVRAVSFPTTEVVCVDAGWRCAASQSWLACDGRRVVDLSDVVVAVALREDLEQLQGAAFALVGRHVLEDGGGSAVLGDDDRTAGVRWPA